MDTSKFDTQIEEALNKKSELLNEMNILAQSIIGSYTEFFKRRFPEMIKQSITSNPELAQELGVEKLGEIKKELNEIMSKLPDITKDFFDRDNMWEHRQGFPDGWEKESLPLYDLRHNAGSKVANGYHDILGYVGQIMFKYGLADNKSGEWKIRANGLPSYAYGLGFYSDEDLLLKSKFAEYKKKFEDYANYSVKLMKIEKEKKQFIAQSLWDQA